MLNNILILIALTLLPFLELRASIPYGVFNTDLHWLYIFIICVITNIILAPIIYLLFDKIVFIATRIKMIDGLYKSYIERTQKRISKYVNKYGVLGVALFIGIPLPGSGVYSGAVGAHLVGIDFKKFIIASIIGVLIAGILVTIICLTGNGLFSFFIKRI